MRYRLLGRKLIYVMFRNALSKNVPRAALEGVKKVCLSKFLWIKKLELGFQFDSCV